MRLFLLWVLLSIAGLCFFLPLQAQTYCAASSNPTCSGAWFIQQVSLDGEKNSGIHRNSQCDDYVDATHLTANIIPGTQYAVEVSTVSLAGNNMGLFIDWNEDGDFEDAGETLLGFANSTAPALFLIVAPQDATPGKKRMRIRAVSYIAVPSACGPQNFGEVEDYSIELFDSIDDVPESPSNPSPPSYCAASGETNCSTADGTSLDYSILNVALAGDGSTEINNASGCERYGDFSHLRATLSPANTYNLALEITTETQTLGNFGVYVDWNNDGTFSETETFITTAQGIANIPIIPPMDVETGIKRMRIRRCSGLAVPTACGVQALGEVEDYSVLVINAPVPDCAENHQPADGERTCQNTTLSWDVVADATDYRVFVKNSSTGTTVVDSIVSSNQIHLTGLDTSTTYQWLVVPREDSTEAVACDTLTFSIYRTTDPDVIINSGSSDTLRVCEATTLGLSATVTGNADPLSYSWTGTKEDHFTSLDIANPGYTPTTSGFYSIQLQVSDTNGCSAMDSAVVNALEKPNASTIRPLNNSICLGDDLRFTSGVSPDSVFAVERKNDGSIIAITPPELSKTVFEVPGIESSTEVAVVQLNAEGCTDTSAFYSITVNTNPDVPVIDQQEALACDGEVIHLFIENENNLDVTWSNGAETDTVEIIESGTYSVLVTNANGCEANSDPFSLTFNAAPAVPIIDQNAPACEGTPIIIYVENPDGNSVIWDDALNTNNDSLKISVSGVYAATVTNAIGCSSENQLEVQFNTPPPAPRITINGSLCEGNSVELLSSEENAYQWNTGETTQRITVTQGGTYSVKVTDINGCQSQTADSNLTFAPVPSTPEIVQEGNALVAEPLNSDLTYHWIDSENQVVAENNGRLDLMGNGTFRVVAVSEDGCVSDTSEAFTFSVVGIAFNDALFHVKLYPNPSRGLLQIDLPHSGSRFKIAVLHVTGKEISSWSTSRIKFRKELSLEKGVYTVLIKEKDQIKSVKWVIQ